MKVKTTLMLRADLLEKIKKDFGRKNISKVVNEILARELLKKEDLFGIDRGMKPFRREHKDSFENDF